MVGATKALNDALIDAVAAANRLTDPLAAGTLSDGDLAAVQLIPAIALLDRLPAIVIGRGLRCERVRHGLLADAS